MFSYLSYHSQFGSDKKLPPIFHSLKQQTFIISQFLGDQKSGSKAAKDFWLKGSHGDLQSQALTGARGSASKKVLMWLLARVFHSPGPSTGLLVSSKHGRWLLPKWVERERERWVCSKSKPEVPFIHLILEGTDITSTIFYMSHGPTLLQHGRAIQNFMNSRRWGPLGSSWRLGYHVCCWSGKISFKSPSCWVRWVDIYCFCCLSSWETQSENPDLRGCEGTCVCPTIPGMRPIL